MNRSTTIAMSLTAGLLLPLLFLQGCSRTPNVWPDKPGKKVLATFAPLYCFVQIVAGDDANVMCLAPATDPHLADAAMQDILKVRGADLLVANGLGIDQKLVRDVMSSASKKVSLLEVGEVMEKKHHEMFDLEEHHDKEGEKHEHKKGEKHDAHDHGHDHGHDGHIWLGPKRAKVMVDIICDRLVELDGKKEAEFRKNAKAFKDKLDELTKYGDDKFKDKKNRKIVSQHDALTYFAYEFDLEIVASISFQDNSGDTPIEKLMKVCKKERPAAFTFESSFNKVKVEAVRDSLKKNGIDTELAEVDPIEKFPNGEPDAEYYLKRMYKNIDNLAQALK